VVFTDKPVNLLVKFPAPDPSVVLLSKVVGFLNVLQQTPLAVIEEPPSLMILPPPMALFCVISIIFEVITVGRFSFLHVFEKSA